MEQAESKVIRLYVVEEQEILRGVYEAISNSNSGKTIDLLGVSGYPNADRLRQMVTEISPDVLLLGIKKLDEDVIKELEGIRIDFPATGIVLLPVFCSTQDIEFLRRLALKGGILGCWKRPVAITTLAASSVPSLACTR